jgi:hypothetical protein
MLLTLVADHSQVLLEDDDGTFHDFADAWTKQASQHIRLAVVSGLVSVGTARDDRLSVELNILAAPPRLDLEAAEHIVEADLALHSGQLAVHAAEDLPVRWRRFRVAPGLYRLRVTYARRMPDEDSMGDLLTYRVEGWPVPHAAPIRVLKQGPAPWAG